MPAPLGKPPTKKMPDIQVFGRDDSPATRAALRFFRERRVVVHYVDLRKRADRARRAPAVHASGSAPAALLDTTLAAVPRRGPRLPQPGRRRDRGRLLADPRLLRLPLARHGNEVTVGPAEGDLGGLAQAAGAS